jgi:hypothetical protein
MNSAKHTSQAPSPHADALEGQLALRLAGHLHRGADALPHDVVERLRFAREQAVAHARLARQAGSATAVQMQGRGSATLAGPPSLWLRLGSALPLLVLVAGLVAIQLHYTAEQIHVAAEIDTALLADELPPAAYRDAGFSEFLRDLGSP